MGSSETPDRGPEPFEVAVVRRAQDRLSRTPYRAVGRVASTYQQGALVLQGCVPSQYLKQVAQEAVSRIEGVSGIINRIEVRVAAARDPSGLGRADWTRGG